MIRQLTQRFKSSFRRKRSATSDWPAAPPSTFRDSNSGLVVHGLHKSATMFLYRFFDELCDQLEIPLYSIHNEPPFRELSNESSGDSFVLCPVRSFETEPIQESREGSIRRLFQVRDPRDVLVSEYFSIGWRHTTAGWSAEELQRRERIRSLSVDQYVLAEPEISMYPLLRRYQPLLDCIADDASCDNTTIVKYETMVTDFAAWQKPVFEALQIDAENSSDAFFRFVNARYRDEFVADESDTGHRRNVQPGDHRDKLSPETIEQLNERFELVLNAFGYLPNS